MLENLKRGLVGRVVEDVALTNRGGKLHARLKLSDTEIPLLVDAQEAEIVVASRKPPARAQAISAGRKFA